MRPARTITYEDTRAIVGRFLLKLSVALLIASFSRHADYLFAFSVWVFAYAFLAAVHAIVRGDRFCDDRLNFWDEAVWLGAVAALSQAATRAA